MKTQLLATATLSVLTTLMLSGCATPYQSMGAAGGFTETQLAPDVFRIRFAGNGLTSPDRAQDFAMLRAADLSLGHGFRYFAVLNEGSGGHTDSFTLPGQSYTRTTVNAYGNTAYGSSVTTTMPGQNFSFFKPEAGLLIRCFPTQQKEIYTFDATFISNTLRQKYQLR